MLSNSNKKEEKDKRKGGEDGRGGKGRKVSGSYSSSKHFTRVYKKKSECIYCHSGFCLSVKMSRLL